MRESELSPAGRVWKGMGMGPWVDFATFDVVGSDNPDARSIFRAFFASKLSNKSFMGNGSWGDVSHHGPYERLEAEWFNAISIDALRLGLRMGVESYMTTPYLGLETTEDVPALSAVAAWADEAEARGDFAFVLIPPKGVAAIDPCVWDRFYEFLTLAPDRRSLGVAVVGDD